LALLSRRLTTILGTLKYSRTPTKMKNDIATTKSVFAKLKGGASLAAIAKLNLNIVNIDVKNKNIK
jgi:hypothetical protein